jgi:hypothetical protein
MIRKSAQRFSEKIMLKQRYLPRPYAGHREMALGVAE